MSWRVVLILLLTFMMTFSPAMREAKGEAAVPKFPFPQHVIYAQGVFLPDKPEETRFEIVARLYDEWKARYLKHNPYDDSQYYIDWAGDEGITVSEAHGYGMLIFAYMAGYEPDAQAIFDGMVRFYLAHLSELAPPLMAWQQADQNGRIEDINGVDSATDGDLDIAYALLLADAQWGSGGEFDYRGLALESIAAMITHIVDRESWFPRIGDWAEHADAGARMTSRPSDYMPGHFDAFFAATGDERWRSLKAGTIKSSLYLYENFSPGTGLLPDFAIHASDGSCAPREDAYSWDACRVPWRLSTYRALSGDDALDGQIGAMNRFIRESAGGVPSRIRCGYKLDGTPMVTYLDPAFAAPFMVAAMVGEENREWLTALYDWNAAQRTRSGGYYDNTLRLLCMIVASGNWWAPEGGGAR